MASSTLQRVFYVRHLRHGAVPCEVGVHEFKFGSIFTLSHSHILKFFVRLDFLNSNMHPFSNSHILKYFVRLEDSAWRAAEAAWALIWKTAKLAASSRGKLDIWMFNI